MVEASAALKRSGGRDHHPPVYFVDGRWWNPTEGTYGKTDELGFHVTENPVHVRLQATILRLLGIDHTRLTFRFQGLDFRYWCQ